MYACGKVAAILDGKMKNTQPAPAKSRLNRPSGVVLPAGIDDPRERVMAD